MQIVKTLCDICYHEDPNRHTESSGSNLIQLNKQNIEIDLCDNHFANLQEALNIYFSLGRRPESFNIKIPKSKKPKDSNPKDSNPKHPCKAPECNRTFDTVQGAQLHFYRVHTFPTLPKPPRPPRPRRQPPTQEELQRRLERKRVRDRERKRELRMEKHRELLAQARAHSQPIDQQTDRDTLTTLMRG